MAWFFVLGAECGERRKDALAVARHFTGLSWTLSDGTVCSTGNAGNEWLDRGHDGGWWAVVGPSGLSTSGATEEREAQQMTEAGHHLYARLRSAPPFRFASVGVEAYVWNTVDNFPDLLRRGALENGLVLGEPLWEQIGRPAQFVPFSPGYRWTPYAGERRRRAHTTR